MKQEELKVDHFYWIKVSDVITIGQYIQSWWGGSVKYVYSFYWIGSEENLDFDEIEVLSEIPFPSFFVPGSDVTLYGEE